MRNLLTFSRLGLILLFPLSCKPLARPSEIETVASRDVCCAYDNGDKGIFYETIACGKRDISDCCETWKVKMPFSVYKSRAVLGASCENPGAQFRTEVQVCRGPTHFREESAVVGGISDSVTGLSRLAHVWLKTNSVEMGMGPKLWPESDGSETALQKITDFFTVRALREKVQVAWRDHSGFSRLPDARCDGLYFCDVACVHRELQLNKDLGVYGLTNQCHLAAVKVLRKCGCHNHCTEWLPGGIACAKRVFPELRGFNLDDAAGDTVDSPE